MNFNFNDKEIFNISAFIIVNNGMLSNRLWFLKGFLFGLVCFGLDC